MNTLMLVLEILALVGIGVAILLWKYSVPGYLKKKGENLATKEDIEAITEKVEGVRVALKKVDRMNEKKYELKYGSCPHLVTRCRRAAS